jgi:hypothetical protein
VVVWKFKKFEVDMNCLSVLPLASSFGASSVLVSGLVSAAGVSAKNNLNKWN